MTSEVPEALRIVRAIVHCAQMSLRIRWVTLNTLVAGYRKPAGTEPEVSSPMASCHSARRCYGGCWGSRVEVGRVSQGLLQRWTL